MARRLAMVWVSLVMEVESGQGEQKLAVGENLGGVFPPALLRGD